MLFLRLIFKNIKKNFFIGLITSFTVFIVLLSVISISFFYNNIKNFWIEDSIGNDKTKYIVTNKSKFIFSKIFKTNDLKKFYDELNTKKYAFYKTKIPTSADIKFMGFDFNTDLFVYGTDKFISTGDKLDLAISSSLVNIYNSQISDNIFLPRLNQTLLKSINVDLIFGKNSFFTLDNYIKLKGNVKYIGSEYPLFGFTIAKNKLEKLAKKFDTKLTIYKVIFFTKDNKYVEKLKKKYHNLSIKGYNDIVKSVNKKLKNVKLVLDIIIFIFYILLLLFILILSILILQKNKDTIKVLYYNGANKLQQFFIILGEFSFYFFIAGLLNFLSILYIFSKIPDINNYLVNRGFINLTIKIIPYSIIFSYYLIVYLLLIVSSFLIFFFNKRKYD